MIVTIHQPDFLPWLGFFDRWKKSNIYIVLDDVQFLRRGWHHRDKIKTINGPKWLTIPVHKKNRYEQAIRDVKIDNTTSWRRSHLRTIEVNYGKALNFKECFAMVAEIYSKNHSYLIDLNMDFLFLAAGKLGIKTPVRMASEFHVRSSSTQRLVDLVKLAGGSAYLTGIGSKSYLDECIFNKDKIELIWQEYAHPAYEQLHGGFVPMLSVLDYLMVANESKES